MTTLLIWDKCDHGIEIYEVTGEHEQLVQSCQGQYINGPGDLPDGAGIFQLDDLFIQYDNDFANIPGFKQLLDDYDSLSAYRTKLDSHIVLCGFIP